MRRAFISVMLMMVCCIVPAYSQMTLAWYDPADGTAGVGLSDTLAWRFSAPLDTLAEWNHPGSCLAVMTFDPAGAMEVTGHRFSDDLSIMAIFVNLQPSTDYVWVFTNARSTSGDSLVRPYAGMFTTAAALGQRSVQGRVDYNGSTDGVVAVLFDRRPVQEGPYPIVKAATVLWDGDDNYVIHNVRDGVYWPVAIRDVNHDGVIDAGVDEGASYDMDGDEAMDSIVVNGSDLTGVNFVLHGPQAAHDSPSALPTTVSLEQNFPNPFNPATEIQFSLPQAQKVCLSVYNILGGEVATLANGTMTAGTHTVQFDGVNLPAGIYFYRLQAGVQSSTRKMMLLK